MRARPLIRMAWGLVVIVSLGGGCATHVPMSESVLFHDGETLPTHRNNVGFGVAATVAPTLTPARAVNDQHPDGDRRQGQAINARRAGGGVFLASYDEEGQYALSATLGYPVAGVDATAKIRGRNYLTIGYSAPRQAQAFLQHRVFNSPRIGAVVGVGGRYDRYAFGGSSILAIEAEHVASIGTRIFGVFREKRDTEGGIEFGTYVGYAPRINRPVVSLTLALGRF